MKSKTKAILAAGLVLALSSSAKAQYLPPSYSMTSPNGTTQYITPNFQGGYTMSGPNGMTYLNPMPIQPRFYAPPPMPLRPNLPQGIYGQPGITQYPGITGPYGR